MKKLDINKLHAPNTEGRGGGKTVKMVAELLGNVDLSENKELHVVFIPNGRRKYYMFDTIADVANAMGIKIEKIVIPRSEIIFENGAKVMVKTAEEIRTLDGHRYREFYDLLISL